MVICYIGIGSNLGDRQKYIGNAIKELRSGKSINVLRVSSIYETEPVGLKEQNNFLNGVIEIETGLTPEELLKEISAIENRLGRKRTVKNGPRTIDLDILYYGDEIIDMPALKIPHPRMMEREFVLRGLKELGKI